MTGQAARPIFLHPVALDTDAAGWVAVPGLIAPSLPGHGIRDRARPGLTLDDMADEIAGWTNGPLHVIGCSMGGMVALHFALRHPDRVASLILAFTTAHVPRDVMLARAEATRKDDQKEMAAATMTRWFTADMLASRPSGVEYAQARLLATDRAAIADAWTAISDHDVVDDLARIGVPTTCIGGEHDVSTPMTAVEQLASTIPTTRLERMDAAHMGFLERPNEFSALVRTHLQWADARRSQS